MRKLFALLILAFMFFPLAMAAMTLTSIRPWVLDRAFYERIVSNEKIYELLLVDQIPNEFSREGFGGDEQMPLRALNLALREVVTADYLRTQAVSVINQVFDFIDGHSENPEITVDVTSPKAALAGAGGARFANTLAAALPSCEPGQPATAPNGRLTRCIEVNSSVDSAAKQIAQALPAVIEDIPNLVRLNTNTDYVNDWRILQWLLGDSIRSSLDVSMFLLIFTAIAGGIAGAYMGAEALHGRLKWLASAMFVPASLFVVMGLSISAPFISSILRGGLRFARWDGIEFTEVFEQTLTEIVMPIVQQIGTGFMITGLAACLIALVLLIWSWSIPNTEQPVSKMVQIPAHKV